MTITPEFIVKHINQCFPSQIIKTDYSHLGDLHCIHDLITKIPDELLYQPNDEYHYFLQAKSKLLAAFTLYSTLGNTEVRMNVNHKHAINIIRDYLNTCPDEIETKMYDNLKFINDEDLKKNLLVDINSIDDAIRNASWKVATVFCGSAIEALLYFALKEKQKISPSGFDATIKRIGEKNKKNLIAKQ